MQKTKEDEQKLVLKKHPLTRAAHFVYLLPFVPTLQPLLVDYRLTDTIVYAAGIVLVLFLVIYSNQRPLVRSVSGGLNLYLHYRHSAEFHPFTDITAYKRLSGGRIVLYSRAHAPVKLYMNKKDTAAVISRLEEEQIHTTDVSS